MLREEGDHGGLGDPVGVQVAGVPVPVGWHRLARLHADDVNVVGPGELGHALLVAHADLRVEVGEVPVGPGVARQPVLLPHQQEDPLSVQTDILLLSVLD